MKQLELLWLVVLACSIVMLNSAYRLAEQGRQEGTYLPVCKNEVYKTENLTEKYREGRYKLEVQDSKSRCYCHPHNNMNLVAFRREPPDFDVMKAYHFCFDCECLQDTSCQIAEKFKQLSNLVCKIPVCNATDKCRKEVHTFPLGNASVINLCRCENNKCKLNYTGHEGNTSWMDYTCE